MGRNRVPFQKGLGLAEFNVRYGTEVGESFGRLASGQIGFMGVMTKRDITDPLDDQRILIRFDHTDGDISIAAQKIFDKVRGRQLNDDTGMLFSQIGKNGWQNLDGDHLSGRARRRPSMGLSA